MTRGLPIIWIAMLLPLTASAEQTSDEQLAFEAFERGSRLFEAEDYLAAARHFEEAFRRMPRASVHYNIARSYELADEPGLAIEHYRAFLEARAGSQGRRRQVQSRITALEQRVGWVRITTDPPGAAVTVDGLPRGAAPVRVALTPGEHEIEAQGQGATGLQIVQVERGELEVNIALIREPDPDREPEPRPREPEPEDDQVEPSRPPDRERRGIGRLHHAFFWSALGLTLTSGAFLAAYGVILLQKSEEYDNLEESDPEEETLLEEGRMLESVVTALWITTGVLVGATALFAVFTDWARLRRRSEADIFAFRVTPGLGSVSVELRF